MNSPAPVVVWLRNDLRLADHEPIIRAVESGAAVLPVYCLDPRQFSTLPSGVPKTGAFRARFLLEALTDLRAACRERGGELVVRSGRPEDVLPALVREVGATRVLCHAEVASEETRVESAVAEAVLGMGARLGRFHGHTLLHPDDLPFAASALPDQFTSFRQRVERDTPDGAVRVRAPIAAPHAFTSPPIVAGEIPASVAALGLAEPPSDARARFVFRGGASAGHERLAHFVWHADRLRHYKDTRNGMLAPDDASKLSPWLAMGCLSPREVWADVQRYEQQRVKNDSTYWLVFELLWRDYFRFLVQRHGDTVFAPGGIQRLRLRWRALDEADAQADFARWTSGTTGLPLVDASMRELSATGFMSNRGRQNVASFLTKNLRIDWRAGAEWFESLLVDYDVASNWGNWLYAAGVGTDGRGFRVFNIHKQAMDYDPSGDYVRHWLPELGGVPGAAAHRVDLLSADEQRRFGVAPGRSYPLPMLDLYTSAKASEAVYRQAIAQQKRGESPRRAR
jgi:deoxyribodipyrimidine photo-lyase